MSDTFRRRPFLVVSGTLTLFLFGASAPTPLYVVYQARFAFSPTTLTAIFGVYALALLLTLVPAGGLSDQLGRRPVILGAITIQAAAMVLFLLADGTPMLFAARIVQGVATGAATGALSAALIDFQPAGSTVGALTASVAPPIGLALGAVCAGVLVQLGTAPLRLVYWVQLAGLALAAAGVAVAVPETIVEPHKRAVGLEFRINVPTSARRAFIALTPGLMASWALAGLFLSLGPSLAVVLLHSRSHVLGALVPATLCFITAIASFATRRWSGRRAVLTGTMLLAVGVLISLVGIRASSAVFLFTGTAVAGLGFGPAFAGSFRTLAPLAPPQARAGLLAAVYVVSYLAFAVPAIVAGLAATEWGLRGSASGYAVAVVVLALAAAGLTARRPPDPLTPGLAIDRAAGGSAERGRTRPVS
ncbi:MAG: MFS transporter [Solirubrobacterales bacterium]|nr:MFS transporter [Solirubrobacterales bacterium]